MSNLEVIEGVYRDLATEDLDRVLERCDPDCVISQDDALPWGGRHLGHDGVATFAMLLGGTINSVITTDALYEAGNHVIQYGRSRGTVLANHAEFDMPEVHAWTLRDEKITAAEFYIDTPAMLHAIAQS